jgi:hypothetical protein
MENDDVNISELEQKKDLSGLIEALMHPDEQVRVDAAKALGRIGDERAIPALTAALHDTAATDPADLFEGNRTWEELGSEKLIYRVRDSAWAAQKMIRGRTSMPPLETTLPGMDPFDVGDIVVQYRSFTSLRGAGFSPWCKTEPGMVGTRWKVLSIAKNEVALELVEGVFEERPSRKRHYPGYVARVSSSDEFRKKFPGTKGKQLAFDTYRKVD